MIPLRDCLETPINTENDIVVSLDAKYIIKEVIFQETYTKPEAPKAEEAPAEEEKPVEEEKKE